MRPRLDSGRLLLCLVAVFCGAIVSARTTAQGPAPAAPTYADAVAPLLATHCVACHHDGGPTPFSLTTFAEASAHAEEIARAVELRVMPKWKPEPGVGGPFVGEHRLSEADIDVFRQWAAAGAPEGDNSGGHDHAGGMVHETWKLGTPDVVVTLPTPFMLAPGERDVFRNFALRLPNDRSRYVRGVEFLPDNHIVTHHANIRVDATAASARLDARDPAPGYDGIASPTAVFPDGYFLGWTPGQGATFAPDGLAWRLAPGSTLAVELHMVPASTPQPVNFRVGLYFAERPAVQIPVMLRLGKQDIDIPAGAKTYSIHDEFVLPVDVDLVSLQPHAHYLATQVSGSARLPDGERLALLLIRDWEFHVQDVYRLVTPQFLPRGTVVQMDYVYDNSASNPRRPPTPPTRVRWGQYTNDEMGDLWLQFLPRNPQERETLARATRAKEITEDVVGYRGLLRKDPRNGLVHANLAAAFIQLGRGRDALEHLEQHARLDPGSAIAFYNRGAALAAANRPDEAVTSFRRAIALDPSDPIAHNGLGGVLLNAKQDLPGALAAFQQAVRLDPSYANGFNNLGVVLSRLGRVNDALVAHLAAAELDDLHADARYNAAVIFETRRQYQAAVSLFREAAKLAPGDSLASLRLAFLLAAAPEPIRDAGAAFVLATTLLKAAPDDPDALDTFAVAAAANNQFIEAARSAKKALDALTARGEREWAAAVAARLELYRQMKQVRLATP